MEKTAQEVFKEIELESNEKNCSELRFIKSMDIGEAVRQGDIYLHKIELNHPKGIETRNHQLAPGNTNGSRHCIDKSISVYEGKQAPSWASRALVGPVIESKERFVVTHPEHAHISLPAGTYQVTYQLDPRTMNRVND